MKSKLNDAELIAEAYNKVEVQEEGLGALAGGIGRAAMGAGRAIKKAATSDTTKKIVRGAGKLAADVAAETGKVAAEVGGEGLRAAGKAVGAVADKAMYAADKGISKLAGEDSEDDFPAADHDAPKGGIGSRSLDREELKAKIDQAKAKGHIDSGDAAQIMRQHDSDDEDNELQAGHPAGSGDLEARNARAHELNMAKAQAGNNEDAEHAAPVEVDMSENPSPESLEVTNDVDVEEEPAAAIVAPSIQPSVEAERVNHHDDSEVKMALAELYKIEKYAFALGIMMKETKALEGWTAAKITKAADYLGSVFHKLDYDFHAEAEDHADVAPEDHEGH